MDNTTLTIITGTFTTLAAIVGPIIGAHINNRSIERVKRMEIYTPQILQAIEEITECYNLLRRTDESRHRGETEYVVLSPYHNFLREAQKLLVLVPSPKLRKALDVLEAELKSSHYLASGKTDPLFLDLLNAISPEVKRMRRAKDL